MCNLPYKHSSRCLIAEKADFPNSLWDWIIAQHSCRKSGKVLPLTMIRSVREVKVAPILHQPKASDLRYRCILSILFIKDMLCAMSQWANEASNLRFLSVLSSICEFYSLVSIQECAVRVIKTVTYFFSVGSSSSALIWRFLHHSKPEQHFCLCTGQNIRIFTNQHSTVDINLPHNKDRKPQYCVLTL